MGGYATNRTTRRLAGAAGAHRRRRAPTDEAVPLKIMIFNIWLGGDQVNISARLRCDPRRRSDILLLQEPEGKTRVFADALGYAHAAERWHMVSRYPIFDPPAADADYALVEIRPGRFVAVVEHPPDLRSLRPLCGARRQDGRGGAGAGDGDAAAGDPGLYRSAVAGGGRRAFPSSSAAISTRPRGSTGRRRWWASGRSCATRWTGR